MTDTLSLIDRLATISYFSGVEAAILQQIARTVIRQEYQEDQIIFLEGEPCAGLYIVDSGWLKAVKISADGREQVVHFLSAGETFNAISIFSEKANPATVIALEPSVVYIIPRATIIQLLEEYPAFARHIIEDLSQRVLHLLGLVEDLSLRTVEARLARYLLKYASNETLERRRWTTQAEIAARLGTVPDVLNRALRTLADAGLIEVKRQQIQILDRPGLELKAQRDS